MSVIVMGMDVPKSCYSCDLARFLSTKEPYCIRTMKVVVGSLGKRPDWCPLQQALEEVQPAAVRPVVLCGECRWFTDTGYPNPYPEMPELRKGHCMILGRDVQACWFCASGGKEGDDD